MSPRLEKPPRAMYLYASFQQHKDNILIIETKKIKIEVNDQSHFRKITKLSLRMMSMEHKSKELAICSNESYTI